MQNVSFYWSFHAFLRSTFSPGWPVPIPGPCPPFPAIIHHYRPSIPPTCSSNFALPKFLQNFLPVSPVPIQNPYPGNFGIVHPYRFFSSQHKHPPCPPSAKVHPFPGSNIDALSGSNSHPCRSIFSVIFANMDFIFPRLRGERWMR